MKWVALAALLVTAPAHACLLERNVTAQGWLAWSQALFAGEVTKVDAGAVTVRVLETFKGPQAATASFTIPALLRRACGVPKPGDRLLVGMNPNGDFDWTPLTGEMAAQLRAARRPSD